MKWKRWAEEEEQVIKTDDKGGGKEKPNDIYH